MQRWLAAGVAGCAILAAFALAGSPEGSAASPRPELEYLKVVNRAGPPRDPEALFLLMGQFANANRAREGAEFIDALRRDFDPRLDAPHKALYLSAAALLRAQAAGDVPLLQRPGWVRETVAMIDDAKRLGEDRMFIPYWVSGVVRSQLPGFFGQGEAARADLEWCVDHADRAPHAGWLREIHYQLATLDSGARREGEAQRHLALSGYRELGKTVTFVTPFSEDARAGHRFSQRRIAEIVPGRVFELSGFEFTEYYFVVSDDGRELIGIDAGTRDDSARAAYTALREAHPALPPLTTILVTHSHWDHIGGHRYFESLDPRPRFVARANYAEEIRADLMAPRVYMGNFFGERYDPEAVRSFRPDRTIEAATELRIGGTRLRLTPISGGETHDGMFISAPDLGVLFVGDFIMPYLGAPFVDEGDLDGLFKAIDLVAMSDAKYLLHGHAPLNRIFRSAHMLNDMKSSRLASRASRRRNHPRHGARAAAAGEPDSTRTARGRSRYAHRLSRHARERDQPHL
jgi:glyoxylase-like metal-dependent hydrolase (beta-lactamase superfamily II)